MLLDVREVTRRYTRDGNLGVDALKGASFTVDRGEFVSIMGPSGSGKSTLLHLIGGLDRPSAGSIRIDGQPIQSFSDNDLSAFRRRRLGFIFQFFNLLPTLSAIENVALPLLLDGKSMSSVSGRAKELLSLMGLDSRMNHRPDQLSGGEMQRVAIARALVTDPLLILADEPTGNLDSKTGTVVLELLARIARERGNSIIMVTHDPRAASYGTRLIQLRDGLIESDERVGSSGETGIRAPQPEPEARV
jgi:putative ABC transport system ATP-binding protein